ncbi:hypothetical protein MKX01_015726 [Papaver californicum]|nr:hypothetical protein MKX01_015726 [Papaver californicum]
MAFLRNSMVSTVLVFVMFLCYNHQPSTFVRADNELISRVCHNTDAPTACNQCVKADNRTVYLQRNISALTSIYGDSAANQTITECRELFSYAKSDLNAATQGLKNGDYDASDKSVFKALRYQNSCKSQFENNQKIRITVHIYFGFNMYEELSQIALRIINRL